LPQTTNHKLSSQICGFLDASRQHSESELVISSNPYTCKQAKPLAAFKLAKQKWAGFITPISTFNRNYQGKKPAHFSSLSSKKPNLFWTGVSKLVLRGIW
jgi:hypothetical protein